MKFCAKFLVIIIFVVNSSCLERRNIDERKKTDSSMESGKNGNYDTTGLAMSANLYYKGKMYNEAINEYSILIQYDSLNGNNYYRRGYALAQLNRHKEAIPDFVKAAELGYDPCKAYHSLAVIYSMVLGNDSLAIIYCEKCLRIDPKAENVKRLVNLLKPKNDII